jgi:hypothetical protein
MTSPAQETTAPPEIEVAINYLVNTGVTPVFKHATPGTDIAKDSARGMREPRVMTVRNARLLPNAFSLDVEGFALVTHDTKVKDFDDAAELAAVYTPELEKLVARVAGATEAVVFDHTRRSTDPAHRAKHLSRDPVPAPHTDYTAESAAQRLRDRFGDAEAERRLQRRFAIVNVWRSMNAPLEQWPLAMCDGRTVDPAHMQGTRREAPERAEPSFEYNRASQTMHAFHDAAHRWYWFPRMARNEALVFKNWDTLTDGTARFALHTAFMEPDTPPNPAHRETIESRLFVFYD